MSSKCPVRLATERLANGQQTTSTATEIRLVHTWTRPASSSSITTTTPMTATMTKIASHGCSHLQLERSLLLSGHLVAQSHLRQRDERVHEQCHQARGVHDEVEDSGRRRHVVDGHRGIAAQGGRQHRDERDTARALRDDAGANPSSARAANMRAAEYSPEFST